MMFVGGDSDHQTLLYFHIKELFTFLGWRCSKSGTSLIPVLAGIKIS
jgi:hypothetical protein